MSVTVRRPVPGRAAAALLLLTALGLGAAGCGWGGRGTAGATGWITGEIKAADTGAPLPATVSVDGVVYQAVNGVYRTSPLPYGSHAVSAAAPGYQAQTTSVNLTRSPYALSFTLSRDPDVTPPRVTGFYPASGSGGVYRDTRLVFSFSEPMDMAGTEQAVQLSPTASFTFTWEDDTHLVATPSPEPLAAGTTYVVTLTTGAKDRAGNALTAPYTATFTTGSGLVPTSRIAFVSDQGGDGLPRLYVMAPAPGATPTPLFSDAVEDGEPSWSPDGTRLVFSSRRGADPATLNLYTARVDAPVPVALWPENGYEDVQPKWSPDGRRIAFVSRRVNYMWNVYVTMIDDQGKGVAGSVKQVTLATNYDDVSSPEWSPDGTLLAFSSTRTDGKRRIYAVDASDTAGAVGEAAGWPVSNLTPDGVREDWPAWWSSPDGSTQRIAYASERNDNAGGTYNWDLWVMDVQVTLDGQGHRMVTALNRTRLTNTPDRNETNPVWSPDGQYLIYVSEAGGKADLYRLTAAAPEVQPVAVANTQWKEISPAWSRR